ncbi:hypothetical protein ASE00_12130 [Sphingomonas sp. Root710]|uniref:hypothetical protein n=1 Tax=Sphingomonas sp. Root710 TaxID=1736594 RepID=UPI0006F47E05|nr:hypothetical protein [Sphingomonas sp. Root710]KRB82768.1 hypothetical protein ASE00_12130 [Sphingomonas sp. Root710]
MMPLFAQLLLALAGLAAFAFAPPASGAILLLPLTAQARADLPGIAVRSGARLIGQGPVAGSLVVRGERTRLGAALLRRGIVPMAAPAMVCGGAAAQESRA